jgi:hypothetical protein
VIPTLVNGTSIMDFAWDPFDYSRLAVGTWFCIIKFFVTRSFL